MERMEEEWNSDSCLLYFKSRYKNNDLKIRRKLDKNIENLVSCLEVIDT